MIVSSIRNVTAMLKSKNNGLTMIERPIPGSEKWGLGSRQVHVTSGAKAMAQVKRQQHRTVASKTMIRLIDEAFEGKRLVVSSNVVCPTAVPNIRDNDGKQRGMPIDDVVKCNKGQSWAQRSPNS